MAAKKSKNAVDDVYFYLFTFSFLLIKVDLPEFLQINFSVQIKSIYIYLNRQFTDNNK